MGSWLWNSSVTLVVALGVALPAQALDDSHDLIEASKSAHSEGSGVPVTVDVIVDEIRDVSISDAHFEIVAEVNLTWVAPDLNGDAISPAGTYTGRAINKILDNSWDPGIYVANAEGPRDTIARSLVVYPDGKMELYEKFAAQLTMDTSVPSYPFGLIDVHLEIQSANHPLPGLVFAPRRFDFGHHEATHTVVKGNWSLNDHHSETSDISSLSHGGSSRFSVAVFHISIVHDFMGVVQKILAPLLAILLLSLIINRFSVIYATGSGAANGSWRAGGQLFVCSCRLPQAHLI